jgi:hypothetical protein
VAQLCDSFRRHNPDFDHRIYSERDAEVLIERHFGQRELAAFRACTVPAMQADYFRYCAVQKLGGVYADADFECLRPLRPLLDRPGGGEVFFGPGAPPLNGRPSPRIWNGFFAFREPGHPLLGLAVEIATANIESRLAERAWPGGANTRAKVVIGIALSVGPGVFTTMHMIWKQGSFDAFRSLVEGMAIERFAESYCEVIGDYGRIIEAFEGVRVSSSDALLGWVDHPEVVLRYKQTEACWHNWHAATVPLFR